MNNNQYNQEYQEQDENKPEKTKDRSGVLYRASGNLFIVKTCSKTIPRAFDQCARSAISGFSPGAGQRMRRYLRECIPEYTTMVTLTYPFAFPTNGKQTKEHLRRFLQEVRREFHRKCREGMAKGQEHSAFWFMEFQSRGAPHYHIFTTWAPNREWVSKRWYEIVGSDDDRHLRAGTKVEFLRSGRAGTISYAAKYAVKQEQKTVPENFENVGRFWGVHGHRATLSATTFVESTSEAFERSFVARKSLFLTLNRFIQEGRAEVVVRDQGVLVVNMPEKYVQQKMRIAISRMEAMVMVHSNMFSDAELDEGETETYQLSMVERLEKLRAGFDDGTMSRNPLAEA